MTTAEQRARTEDGTIRTWVRVTPVLHYVQKQQVKSFRPLYKKASRQHTQRKNARSGRKWVGGDEQEVAGERTRPYRGLLVESKTRQNRDGLS